MQFSTVLKSALVLSAVAAVGLPGVASASLTPEQNTAAEKAGRDAIVYGYPLVQMDRLLGLGGLAKAPNDPATGKRTVAKFNTATVKPNQMLNLQFLATAATKTVVMPNADTIYQIVNLDLRSGPVLVDFPAYGKMADGKKRYWCLELVDSATNVFGYVGTRMGDTSAGTIAIVPPGWSAATKPLGQTVKRIIRSTSTKVWVIGRVLVDSVADTSKNAAPLQNKTVFRFPGTGSTHRFKQTIVPAAKFLSSSAPPLPTAQAAVLDEIGAVLADQPPPSADAAMLASLAPYGIGPGLYPTATQSPEILAALERGMQAGLDEIEAGVNAKKAEALTTRNGWVLFDGVGTYGTDWITRAVIADYGLGANIPAEAVYPAATTDSAGAALDGSKKYRIRFANGKLPPHNAFWSITMYGTDKYFVKNSINRYAIGDRTGMKTNADGSTDILIQATEPAGKRANWLPSPSGKPFILTMRIYLPAASALNGTWKYPKIEKLP